MTICETDIPNPKYAKKIKKKKSKNKVSINMNFKNTGNNSGRFESVISCSVHETFINLLDDVFSFKDFSCHECYLNTQYPNNNNQSRGYVYFIFSLFSPEFCCCICEC